MSLVVDKRTRSHSPVDCIGARFKGLETLDLLSCVVFQD